MKNNDKSNNTFSLRKDDAIYLYGAGYLGKVICNELLKQEYNVRAIIDERAEEIKEYQGISVYRLDEIKSQIRNENGIVIICLQNGVVHEKIALRIASADIYKILFLPMSNLFSLVEKSKFRKMYRAVLEHRFGMINNVPCYCFSNNNLILVIDENEESISFWCPIKYLRVASKVMMEQRISNKLINSKKYLFDYADKELDNYKPYIELFDWLGGEKNSDIELYLDAMGRLDKAERSELLRDRMQLYRIYEEALKYDLNFFLDAAAIVKWNVKGYFNVEDGMHRIQYLMKKGYTKVPVFTSQLEYSLFLDCISKRDTTNEK